MTCLIIFVSARVTLAGIRVTRYVHVLEVYFQVRITCTSNKLIIKHIYMYIILVSSGICTNMKYIPRYEL